MKQLIPHSRQAVYLLLLYLCTYGLAYGQEKLTVSGVVRDADGPLVGVTVWQEGTATGTLTDEQGRYRIELPPGGTLSFNYIGYKTQSHTISGTTLNITLQPDEAILDEIVVNAGYYSVKDRERTGSIARVTAKDIELQPVINPLQAIQGRMAGIFITQGSGVPGSGFNVQIRGQNSLRIEGNIPLYIIDGIPYNSHTMSDPNISGGILPLESPLNNINIADIESIEVLKDADATAIYGSRGANGVILVTTKKGTKNQTRISFQSTTSISKVAKFMDLMSTEEYLQVRKDAFINDKITEYPANAYDINGSWDKNRYTDWQKEFIGKSSISAINQLSVSGGTTHTSYLLGVNNRQEETVFPGDFGYKRTGFSLNLNHSSKDEKFRIQTSIQKSDQNNKLMLFDLTSQSFLAPNAPLLYDSDKNLNWENNTFENPLAKLNEKYTSKSSDLLANLTISYQLSNTFRASLLTGFVEKNGEETRINPSTIYNPSYNLGSDLSSMFKTDTYLKSWIIEPNVSWKVRKRRSKWEGIIGFTLEEKYHSTFGIHASNFTSNDLIYNAANAATQTIRKDSEVLYRYTALFGRFNYNYDNRYIVNLTGRRDGSSRFGPDRRFGSFGAIGVAWVFSKEKALESSKWISFGKLRMSYGITGNDLIGDYQYLNTMGISSFKYDGEIGLQPLRLYNPYFSWETNKKLETALDIELLNSRITSTIAWYTNRSSNQLVEVPLPRTTGFDSIQDNLNATIQNTGWEFNINTINISDKNIQWHTSFNISFPRNKLIAFPNLEGSTYSTQYEIGKPLNIKKLYRFSGVNRDTGIYEVEDVNQDGVIDIEDRVDIMEIGMKYYGGLTNTLSYKKWTMDFVFHFVKQRGYTADFYSPMLGISTNSMKFMMDYWTPENPNAQFQKPSSGMNPDAFQAFQRYKSSNAIITDTSFIRLKTVQLTYNLPIPKSKMNILLFAQGTNLYTFTKYKGLDPETISSFLPPLRTYSLGVNVKF